ncbi:MAG: hypothetical protein NVS1B4_24820 [Gemmatimonadaceae bacterium]
MSARREGFTIVEVIVAILVVSIGLLALASSSAAVTRMASGGQSAGAAATFAGQRLDLLRMTACGTRTAGADTLRRNGAAWNAINSWTWTDAGGGTYRVRLVSTYRAGPGVTRADTLETTGTCVI